MFGISGEKYRVVATNYSVTCIRCNKKTLIKKCPNCGNDVYSATDPGAPGVMLACTVCHWESGDTWVCECGCENIYSDRKRGYSSFDPALLKQIGSKHGIWQWGFMPGCLIQLVTIGIIVFVLTSIFG